MAPPWGIICAWLALAMLIVSGIVLLGAAIGRGSVTLLLVCLALVVWPILGKALVAWAENHAQDAPSVVLRAILENRCRIGSSRKLTLWSSSFSRGWCLQPPSPWGAPAAGM